MVWNRCIDAFVRNDPPVSRVVNAVQNEVHMMNVDIAEDEDFVFVEPGMFHFEHPWAVGGGKNCSYLRRVERWQLLELLNGRFRFEERFEETFDAHAAEYLIKIPDQRGSDCC